MTGRGGSGSAASILGESFEFLAFWHPDDLAERNLTGKTPDWQEPE
jgi:hypothetical protein